MSRTRFPWSRLMLAGGTTMDARRWYPLGVSSLGTIIDAIGVHYERSYITWRAMILLPRAGAEDAVALLSVYLAGRGRGTVRVRMRLDPGDAAGGDGIHGAPLELGPAWRREAPDTLVRDPEPAGSPTAAQAEIVHYLACIGDVGAARIRLLPPPTGNPHDEGLTTIIWAVVSVLGMAALAIFAGVANLVVLASQGALSGSLMDWLLWLVIACAVAAIGWSLVVYGATRVLPPIREFLTILIPTPAVVQDGVWLGTVGLLFVLAPLVIGAVTVAALNAG